MRNDIVEILCDINPLLDPDDEEHEHSRIFRIKTINGVNSKT